MTAGPSWASARDPDPAAAAAYTFAASQAARAAQALDTVLRLAGLADERDRERAHEAFALAFPISYRRWRANHRDGL